MLGKINALLSPMKLQLSLLTRGMNVIMQRLRAIQDVQSVSDHQLQSIAASFESSSSAFTIRTKILSGQSNKKDKRLKNSRKVMSAVHFVGLVNNLSEIGGFKS